MSEFIQSFKATAAEANSIATKNGWWESNRGDAECIALMHSELSEALEHLRKVGCSFSEHIPPFLGVEEELADVIIRIMDFSVQRGCHVAEAIVAKMEFNKSRAHKHGKEF